MTQEDKDLLLKDLCGRLPYGVRIKIETITGSYARVEFTLSLETFNRLKIGIQKDIYSIKPYLRPMSSMTREEKEYAEELSNFSCTPDVARRKIDFYLENHIDFRGLIEKGLAIKVTKENNPYKI